MALADDILVFRAKNNLTQESFAELCNLSKQTILHIEKGKCNPSKWTLARINLVLNGGVYEIKRDED